MDIVKLKQISTINMGQSPKSESYNYEKDGLPFFQGKADFGEVYPTIRMYCNEPIKIAEKNDILMSVRAPVGDVNISNFACCIGRGLAGISPNSEVLYYKYLFYVLKYKKNEISNKGTGSTFKAINKGIIENIEIPLPDLQIQHKIADVLDKAQFLIDKRKEQIKECDILIKSLFYDMFGDPATNPKGWSCRSFKSVARIATISADMDEIGEDDLYVGLEHIEKDTGKILEYVRAKDVDLKSDKFKFNEGMILYGKLRPYLNKVALIKQSGVCSTDILPILPNNDFINIYYLLYYMRDRYFVNSMTQRAIGANLPRVNKRVINSFRIMLPPLELQNEFARKVEKIEHQKQLLEKSLSLMEDNFNSLMQKAFRGELF